MYQTSFPKLENKMYNRIKMYILYEVTRYIWLFLPINLVL